MCCVSRVRTDIGFLAGEFRRCLSESQVLLADSGQRMYLVDF